MVSNGRQAHDRFGFDQELRRRHAVEFLAGVDEVGRADHPHPQALDVRLQLEGQAAVVAGCVQPCVVQRAIGGLQRERKVPHCSQEHRDTRFASPHVCRLLDHLGHPDRVDSRIEPIEGGGLEVELVAQHQHQ